MHMKYKEFPTWAHIIILLLSSLYAWVLLFKVNEWGAFPTPKENWRFAVLAGVLGCVDKKDSPARLAVIQDHLYVGGDLGTQSDVRRRMGIL